MRHGGKRTGAGRPTTGEKTEVLTVTLSRLVTELLRKGIDAGR